MKKIAITAGIVLLGSHMGMQTVNATGDSATTTGKIKFIVDEDNTVTPPVDPEGSPGEPINPAVPEGGSTGNGGPLSLDFAPNFDFSEQVVSTTTKTYYAGLVADKETGREVANFVQLSDKRGTGAGWTLSVIQNGQFSSSDGDVLTGAELHLKHATHNSNMPATVAPDVVASDDVTLGLETAEKLVEAQPKTGMGMHQLRFGNNLDTDKEGNPQEVTAPTAVALVVPGSAIQYAKEYTTTLEWVLSELPTNTEA